MFDRVVILGQEAYFIYSGMDTSGIHLFYVNLFSYIVGNQERE